MVQAMTPTWKTSDDRVRLFLGDCLDVLPSIDPVDAIFVDAPYSRQTHQGHDASADGHKGFGFDGANRQAIIYQSWSQYEVGEFCRVAAAACNGWILSMTDHWLAPEWRQALTDCGRYVFAPLPYYAPGSRVRLSGDGPSSWTIWLVASRTAKQSRWGTLPGGYVRKPGWESPQYIGGKPVQLLEELIGDYSRPGQVVCDPCCGSGTAGVAAIRKGRAFVGVERDRTAFGIAVARIEAELSRAPLFDEPTAIQSGLF